MNGIFMGGLKISRAAGRGARRPPLVVRNFLSFATFIFIYHAASAGANHGNENPRVTAASPCHAAQPKTDFVGVFPLIILERKDRAKEQREENGNGNSTRTESKQVVVRRNAIRNKKRDERSGVLYRKRRKRRRKPLFFLRCRLSSRGTSGAPKRDENSASF